MSMDKSAIEHIQQLDVVKAIADNISNTTAMFKNGAAPFVMVPHDFEKLDLEKYMPTKQRFTGSMNTSVIEDFARYAEDHANEDSAGFVNQDEMSARIIFDLGHKDNPLHAEHSATLTLDKTSAYSELLKINGNTKPQKVMAEWLEDMLEHISFIDAEGESLNSIEVITAVRNVTIEALKTSGSSVNNYDAEMSSIEKIGLKDASQMPHLVIFKCTPYHGLSEREFKLRLSITTSDKPAFTLRIVNYEMAVEEMSAEFVNVLGKQFAANTVDPGFIRGKFSVRS